MELHNMIFWTLFPLQRQHLPEQKNDHNFFLLKLQLSLIETCSILDPVVQRLISANPGLNFNQGVFNPWLKSLFRIIHYNFFRASNHQITD